MLTGSRRKASDARGRAAAPRPMGRGATAVSAVLLLLAADRATTETAGGAALHA
jgi:hypothetical protein